MNDALISATADTVILMPPAPDALDRLLASIDGPTALLVAAVLRERIDLYPTARATVFACSMRTIVQALEMRRDQHRASPFALDRTANLAQIATSQLECWEEYAAHDSVDMSTDREIAGLAAAKARAQVLDELLACLREGSASPRMPTWANEGPPDIVDEAGDPICDSCNGSGEGQHGGQTCTDCKGLGVTALDVRA